MNSHQILAIRGLEESKDPKAIRALEYYLRMLEEAEAKSGEPLHPQHEFCRMVRHYKECLEPFDEAIAWVKAQG